MFSYDADAKSISFTCQIIKNFFENCQGNEASDMPKLFKRIKCGKNDARWFILNLFEKYFVKSIYSATVDSYDDIIFTKLTAKFK